MMFECDNVSYQVSEFSEKFKHDFPKVAMLEQGFCGEIVTDTFSRQQVIRIHTSSSQCRVVAVAAEETGRKCDNYSIPLDLPIKFCVKKGSRWKGSKEFSLSEIIEKNKLPVVVQFAKDETITVGSVSLSTSSFPALKLTHTVDEIYLQGNFIKDGDLDPHYVRIPLYLKDLRLCLITGIKGRTAEYWKLFQDELTAKMSNKFDLNYGRKDSSEYSEDVANDPLYEELQPSLSSQQYESIQSFSFYKMKQKPRPVPEESDRSPDSPIPCNLPPELPPRNPETTKRGAVQYITLDEQIFLTSTREITKNTSDNALPADIDQYKIKDVSEALRLLKLEKYIQEFAEEMVDGRMLRSIDENFLRDEFNFTRIEALRLMNYVKDGHIPK